jgi:hypothetical protein
MDKKRLRGTACRARRYLSIGGSREDISHKGIKKNIISSGGLQHYKGGTVPEAGGGHVNQRRKHHNWF